jgi:hypothetical protein
MYAVKIQRVILALILVGSLPLLSRVAACPTAADTVAEGYADTSSGVKIHYLQSGDVNSTHALILIPGWRLPAYLWSEQLTRFAPVTKTAEGNTPEARASDPRD